MAKQSTLALTVTISGDGMVSADVYTPPGLPLINATAPGGPASPITLASGDNTINVPAGAMGFCYVPPSGSVVAKQLRSGAGVTGPSASASLPLVWIYPSPAPSTMVINAASGESGWITWF